MNASRHRHKKSLGQHFLTDAGLLRSLVSAINPQENEHLIEIGPGEGVLSQQLYPLCRQLTLIELDDSLVAQLQVDLKGQPSVNIIHANALRFDYAAYAVDTADAPVRIIGNLPYNISSQLILTLVATASYHEMYFVIQRELAQRLCASVSQSGYGRLTVMANVYCQSEVLFDLPPDAFFPPPQVWSSLIRIVPIACTLSEQEKVMLTKIARAAFGKRRKQLTNSLGDYLSADDLSRLDIDPRLRAENLSLSDYLRIVSYLLAQQ